MATRSTADFLQQLLGRLRRRVLWREAARGLLLAGALMCLLAPFYLLRGHAVPGWLGLVVLLGGIGFAGWQYRRREPTLVDAAAVADATFGLKDTLASAHAFEVSEHGGAFAALTRRQAEAWVSGSGEAAVEKLPGEVWWRVWLPTVVVAAAGMLVFVPGASPEVRRLEEERAAVREQTAALNEALKKELEALAEQLPEEETGLARGELQEWLKELQRTPDLREAMRQYARLEQHLKEAADRLSQHDKQALLRESGLALEKDPRHRNLSQHLQHSAYQQAAAELRKMDPAGLDLAAPAAAKEQLEALRSAARRMAEPANRAPEPGAGQSKGAASDGPRQDQLTQALVNLDSASRRLEDALRQAGAKEGERLQSGQSEQGEARDQPPPAGDPQGAQQGASEAMGEMEEQLQRLERDQKLGRQLQQMRQALSQSQSGLGKKPGRESPAQALARMLGQDEGQGQAGGEGKGGKDWGTGTVESRRLGRDALPGTDKTLELRGRPGEGASDRAIESTDSGVGAASRMGEEQKRRYRQQAESFLRRDDIPVEVRDGVKTYFETIQQPVEPAPAAPNPPPAPTVPPLRDEKPART